jgi:hypothetical protein
MSHVHRLPTATALSNVSRLVIVCVFPLVVIADGLFIVHPLQVRIGVGMPGTNVMVHSSVQIGRGARTHERNGSESRGLHDAIFEEWLSLGETPSMGALLLPSPEHWLLG